MSYEYTGNTYVTFGQHRGLRLKDVPGSYWIWMYESQDGINNPHLLKWVEDNYAAIVERVENE